ncbi:MAG TPA: hypothetical protein VF337_01305 [Candidatus Limnocylindrales bacterium]
MNAQSDLGVSASGVSGGTVLLEDRVDDAIPRSRTQSELPLGRGRIHYEVRAELVLGFADLAHQRRNETQGV